MQSIIVIYERGEDRELDKRDKWKTIESRRKAPGSTQKTNAKKEKCLSTEIESTNCRRDDLL